MIYVIGNGGSMCNAMHLAEDLMSHGEPANALDNIGRITAIANDHGYEYVFSKQLEEHRAGEGDTLVCYSVSGNSPNVINAIKYAQKNGMHVVAFTGKTGGKIKGLVENWNPSPNDDFNDAETFFADTIKYILKEWTD